MRIIANPHDSTCTKRWLWEQGVAICTEFCRLNSLKVPTFHDTMHPAPMNRWQMRGLYLDEHIWVDLKRAVLPVKVPGYSWSFTGAPADLTPAGVLAHETGHHAWSSDPVRWRHRYGILIGDPGFTERAVSGYGPIVEEDFAEACRLFILNPELLAKLCPRRYEVIYELLQPVHRESWTVILRHAHAKYLIAIQNRIDKVWKSAGSLKGAM